MLSSVRPRIVFQLALAAAFMFLQPSPAVAAQPPGIPTGWISGYAYSNGARLHYYRSGESTGKPVIVMVHGVTDGGLTWAPLAWKLQDRYDIYMLDARGHGLSDPFTPNDDGDTLIKDVVGFVKGMNFEKPILLGHSMGAATVMRVGAEYPDLAKAVIMLDPGVGGGGPGRGGAGARGAGARGAGDPSVPGAPRGGRGGPPPAATAPNPAERTSISFSMNAAPEVLVAQNNFSYDEVVAYYRNRNPNWSLIDCQYLAIAKKQYHGPYSSEAFGVMSGSMQTGDSLAKITVPALILKADAPAESRRGHLEAASAMQKGKLVHIDGAGHNLHRDDLPRTFEVINEFLATL